MHTLRSSLLLYTEARRIGRFLETRPLGRSPRGASIAFHAEAFRDLRLPFGKTLERVPSPPRRNVLVWAIPSSHDLGPRASGSGGSAASRHLGFQESPTEQPSEAAFSSVPRHFRAGILFELGFRTGHLAVLELASVPKHLGSRVHRLAGVSGVAFSAAPRRFGSGSPFHMVLQPRSVLPWSATPKMRWKLTSPAGVTIRGHVVVHAETLPTRCFHQVGPSGRCRPALPFAAAPKRIGLRLCRSTAPSKRPFRRAEAQRASVFGGEPSSHPPVRSFSATSNARQFASSTVGWSSGKPFKPGFPATSGSELHRCAETLQIWTLPSEKPSGATSSTAPKRRRSGIPIRPSLQATSRFRRSPSREYASDPDSPPDLRPCSPSPPGSPCFGAEAPRWGRSFEQRP